MAVLVFPIAMLVCLFFWEGGFFYSPILSFHSHIPLLMQPQNSLSFILLGMGGQSGSSSLDKGTITIFPLPGSKTAQHGGWGWACASKITGGDLCGRRLGDSRKGVCIHRMLSYWACPFPDQSTFFSAPLSTSFCFFPTSFCLPQYFIFVGNPLAVCCYMWVHFGLTTSRLAVCDATHGHQELCNVFPGIWMLGVGCLIYCYLGWYFCFPLFLLCYAYFVQLLLKQWLVSYICCTVYCQVTQI